MSNNPVVPTITLYFSWKSLQPDHRQWKPSNPIIEVNGYLVAVDVPLLPDLIKNATAIMTQQLSNQKEDYPVLTPLGMRYCIDQFEAVMSDSEKKTTESTGKDEWAEVAEEVPTKTAKDDSWDESETDEPSVEKTDENWDEDWS